MANVVLARAARRGLLQLEWTLVDAAADALALLERDPTAGYELRGRLRALSSLRIGSYRVIYQLTDGGETVRVVSIRHRAVAYLIDPR